MSALSNQHIQNLNISLIGSAFFPSAFLQSCRQLVYWMIIFTATSRNIIISAHLLHDSFSCRLLVLLGLQSAHQQLRNFSISLTLVGILSSYDLTIFCRFDPTSMCCCCHLDRVKEATTPLLHSRR